MAVKNLGLALVLWAHICAAQSATDIFLFDLRIDKGDFQLLNGKNIYAHSGYDNQPYFSDDGKTLYFASIDSTGQSDIHFYAIGENIVSRFYSTPDNEFSPQLHPDKSFVTCVLQDKQGNQFLSGYQLNTLERKDLIRDQVVGYYGWVDKNTVVTFVLPGPFTLRVNDLKRNTSTVIADSLGRSIHRIPGKSSISFISCEKGHWFVQELRFPSREIAVICPVLEGSLEKDMAWTPDGRYILMSKGNQLYTYDVIAKTGWQKIQSEATNALNDISRIAISKNGHIALVVNEQ